MNPMQAQVTEFHNALELPARDIPTTLPYTERLLRARLILEEAEEVIESLGFEIVHDIDTISLAPKPNGPHHPSLQVKELCDLLYVIFGTAATMGIDLEPFFSAVHENNMTKVGGEVRPDGKRLKPPGYKPISLHTMLLDYVRERCSTCRDYNGEGPPHFASIRCQSGMHNHCSCDTCF